MHKYYTLCVSCVPTVYAIVHCIYRSVVVAKLLYASSAWEGFANATDRNKIQSFINKSKRNGYCSPDFNNLCTSVKVDVFNKDLKITIHVGLLHPLLPPPSVIQSDMVYEFYDPEYMTGLYQRKAQTL